MSSPAPSSPSPGAPSITKAFEVRHAATGTVFSRTAALPSAIDPPGRHERVEADVDANVFSIGKTTAKRDPSRFLTKHSGVGGNATTVIKALVCIVNVPVCWPPRLPCGLWAPFLLPCVCMDGWCMRMSPGGPVARCVRDPRFLACLCACWVCYCTLVCMRACIRTCMRLCISG